MAETRADVSGDCIFKCGDPSDETMMAVEMNVDVEGTFHANQDHINQSVRVSGVAHMRCYGKWYEETYKSRFTITP